MLLGHHRWAERALGFDVTIKWTTIRKCTLYHFIATKLTFEYIF